MASRFGGVPVEAQATSRFGGIALQQPQQAAQPEEGFTGGRSARAGQLRQQREVEQAAELERIRAENPFLAEQIEQTSPLEALAVGGGRGLTTLARGVGLAEPESPEAARAIAGLKTQTDAVGAGELIGEAAPFLIPGGAAARVASLPGRLAATGAVGAAEGGIIAKGEGGDAVDVAVASTIGALIPAAVEAAPSVKRVVSEAARNIIGGSSKFSDEAASKILANTLVREGITPDEAIAKFAELGPDAIPADIGSAFARDLRAAMNIVPKVEGKAARALAERHGKQAERVFSAVDDATGTPSISAADEIERLNDSLRPEIDRLYGEARAQPLPTTGKLANLLSSDAPLIKTALRSADDELANEAVVGGVASQLDRVDATKRALDDIIGEAQRTGKGNKARQAVRVKNALIEEADKAIPAYKEARSIFAGKVSLESATDLGRDFIKMPPREIAEAVKTMGESEKRFFKLGAKEAIVDRIENAQTSADITKLFGKNGSIKKLRTLFDDPEALKEFESVLERESNFVRTKNAAVANSTSIKQALDAGAAEQAAAAAQSLLLDPTGGATTIGRIVGNLTGGAGKKAREQAISEAGEILFSSGMDIGRLEAILKRQNTKVIEKELRRAANKAASQSRKATAARVALPAIQEDQRQSRRERRRSTR